MITTEERDDFTSPAIIKKDSSSSKKRTSSDSDEEEETDDEEEAEEGEDEGSLRSGWSQMGGDDDSVGSGEHFVDISSLDDHDGELDHRSHSSAILGTDHGESSGDDPIRLYLREIGRENLLTAEQEVELSKKWRKVRKSSRR